jgi:hypothetical protein
MNYDNNLRITIIGHGNLIESLWPCISSVMGSETLKDRINSTTTDEADLEHKRAQTGIEVILNDNLGALKAMEPNIIFFAPPPDAAMDIIQGELKTYFKWIKSRNKRLPEIYAFPPVPGGEFYQKVLGHDVRVANIIPTPFNIIGGKPLVDEGFYVCTFPLPWPEENKFRLCRFFALQGAYVELKADQLLDMLGGATAIFTITKALLTTTASPAGGDLSANHGQQAEYLRKKAQNRFCYHPTQSDPCRDYPLTGHLTDLLDALFESWCLGVEEYYKEIDFPTQATRVMLSRNFDLALHLTQVESKAGIQNHINIAATKGGLMEKAMAVSTQLTAALIEDAVRKLPGVPNNVWKSKIRDRIKATAYEVRLHGQKLGG